VSTTETSIGTGLSAPARPAAGRGPGKPAALSFHPVYNDFYGFLESPFNLTPDPRFLFFSDKHREAFHHVLFGIRERKGFIQLTGEVGAGKTTVCRALLTELGAGYQTALILNPMLSGTQLVRSILTELGLEIPRSDRTAYLDVLNRFLLEQAEAGRDVVLLIDEAQDLPDELLEQVRLLSNLETDRRKLIQIVLVGQPELRDKLNARSLRQLRQRITVRYHLGPLDLEETERYIAHRLRVAGADGRPTFTRGAMRVVHRYARGVPRLINAVCDKALLYGYVNATYELKGRAVRQAIRELEGVA
jgi:general secretion pathway protein A